MTDEEGSGRQKRRARKGARSGGRRAPKDRHDRLVRDVLAHPERISGELQAVLPPKLVAALHWSSVEREPGTFVDDEGESRTDLLFSVATHAGRRVFVYVLFEHQSKPDRTMLFRFLVYLGRAWLELLGRPEHGDGVPPIVPVVLHNGEGGWTAPRRLSEVIRWNEDLREILAPFVPDFELVVDDLTRVPELTLADRRMHPTTRLVLVALRIDRLGHDPALTARWAEVLNDAAAMEGPAALEHVLRYLVESVAGSEWLEALTTEELSTLAKEGIVTLQQQWLQEGIDKGLRQGIEQGIEQGLEQGLEQGRAEVLLEQLEVQFGSLPAEAVAQVRAGTAEDLRRWARAVLTAKTLASVFDA